MAGRSITDFRIEVSYSREDEVWIANVPDPRGCAAHGPTPQAAVAEVAVAVDLRLDSARAHGDPIPTPTQPPATSATA